MYANALDQIFKKQEEQGEGRDLAAEPSVGTKGLSSSRGASDLFVESIEKLKGIDGFSTLAQYEAMFALRKTKRQRNESASSDHDEEESDANGMRRIQRSDYAVSFSTYVSLDH